MFSPTESVVREIYGSENSDTITLIMGSVISVTLMLLYFTVLNISRNKLNQQRKFIPLTVVAVFETDVS